MRTRAFSSVGVVILGLLPSIVGGPIFALAMGLLAILAYTEFRRFSVALGSSAHPLGWLAIATLAVVAVFSPTVEYLFAALAIAVGLTLVNALSRTQPSASIAVSTWAFTVAGTLYLGLPVFAAIMLRGAPGTIEAVWLKELAAWSALGWESAPRGLAWLLIVILATWSGDTLAYIGGRSFGRRLLLPRISPKKTIEGAISGLIGSGVIGAVGVVVFGLGVQPIWGAIFGICLGGFGQAGDLAESLLKRSANVSDSGTLIPGHGGVLDRIDALLFALSGGWLMATVFDRFAL